MYYCYFNAIGKKKINQLNKLTRTAYSVFERKLVVILEIFQKLAHKIPTITTGPSLRIWPVRDTENVLVLAIIK